MTRRFLGLLVQEYIVNGSNRTAARGVFTFALPQGGGPFGGASDDHSTHGYQWTITPFQEVGMHELECYAFMYGKDITFDPDPVFAASASACFTGECPGGLKPGGLAVTPCHGIVCAPCCNAGPLCRAVEHLVQRPPRVLVDSGALRGGPQGYMLQTLT